MNIRNFISLMAGLLPAMMLSPGCSTADDDGYTLRHRKRDKIENVSNLVKECPFEEVMIGAVARFSSDSTHLFIVDHNSSENFIHAFSPSTFAHLGSFGIIGPGPGEIQIPGNFTVNEQTGTGYLCDYGHWNIAAFNIDSVLTVADYKPWIRQRIENSAFPDSYVFVNDSTGYAREVSNLGSNRTYTQALCTFGISTGTQKAFAPEARREGNRSIFAVSATDSILVEGCLNNDLLVIYDLLGNIIRQIKGPQYSPEPDKETSYFCSIEITPNFILASYSGGPVDKNYFGSKIHVLRHDGEYVKTLEIGHSICDMEYHRPTNRLFINSESEMQFGYLDLDSIDLRGCFITIVNYVEVCSGALPLLQL